jgi:bacterioferritin (cytochrome b1)
MIKEDLIAERIVIEVYQQMIRHFADHDPTTRVMIEGILARRGRACQRSFRPAVHHRSPQR